MAITSYPFNKQETSETQYSDLFRELQDTGIVGRFGDASLRVSADSTGMNAKVSPGAAIVRGFYMSSIATEVLEFEPATSLPRNDLVVARLDPAAKSIDLAVKTGTPAVSPSRPLGVVTDTGIWELELAAVAVRAGTATINAADVTDLRPWIGNRVGYWATAQRPRNPRHNLGYNTTTSRWEFHNGNAWTALVAVPSAHTHSAANINSGVFSTARIPAVTNRMMTSRPWRARVTNAITIPGNSLRSYTINFPASVEYSSAPIVHITLSGIECWTLSSITNVTRAGFTVHLRNLSPHQQSVFVYISTGQAG